MPINVVEIKCFARPKGCKRNIPSGFRYRGYDKCFGCKAALAKDEHGNFRLYNSNNFNIEEIREEAKKRLNESLRRIERRRQEKCLSIGEI